MKNTATTGIVQSFPSFDYFLALISYVSFSHLCSFLAPLSLVVLGTLLNPFVLKLRKKVQIFQGFEAVFRGIFLGFKKMAKRYLIFLQILEKIT